MRWPVVLFSLLLAGCNFPSPFASPKTVAPSAQKQIESLQAQIRRQQVEVANSYREAQMARSQTPLRAEPETDPEVLAAGGKAALQRKQLEAKIRQPNPAALPELRRILADPKSLHSARAATALAALRSTEAERVLVASLKDPRVQVRQAVLAGLIDMRAGSARGHCRHYLTADRHADIRSTAALGLGVLEDRASMPALGESLRRDTPPVQYSAAWALARMDQAAGFNYLSHLALARDSAVSPKALQTLGGLASPRSVPAIYRALFDPKDPIWEAAVAALGKIPEASLRQGMKQIRSIPPGELALRTGMVLCLAGKGRLPVASHILAERGTEQDRILALRCMARAGSPHAIPIAIAALNHRSARTSLAANKALQALVARYRLPPYKQNEGSWWAWWYRQYQLLRYNGKEALLLDPLEATQRVKQGVPLPYGNAIVTAVAKGFVTIRVGREEIHLKAHSM